MTTPAERAILDLIEEHDEKGPDTPGWIHTRRHHFERGILLVALDRVRNAEAQARTFDVQRPSDVDGPLGF